MSQLNKQVTELPLEDFIRHAYWVTMNREPGAEEIGYYTQHFSQHNLPRWYIFKMLSNSEEFDRSLNPLHYAREVLVREKLPTAETIVDLGGSTPHSDEGALYLMGYRPKAKRLMIVDLPPEDRFNEWKKSGDSEPDVVRHDEGVCEYVYGSIADLDFIKADAFADMVFSGNSIEHITEEEGDGMLSGAFRILKPGGYLCLDTPNREVTKLIFGDAFCHIDHRLEYTDATLAPKLEKHGFVIEERLGIMDCSGMRQPGAEFSQKFQMDSPLFTENIDDGYLLYYKARKP